MMSIWCPNTLGYYGVWQSVIVALPEHFHYFLCNILTHLAHTDNDKKTYFIVQQFAGWKCMTQRTTVL